MGKDQFEELFEHLFEEAVLESYEFTHKLSKVNVKHSWESIAKKIEEQRALS